MNGTCTACGQPCKVGIIDNGIGAYEFWGDKCVDIQLEAVSDCCEAPAVNSAQDEITVREVKEYQMQDNFY